MAILNYTTSISTDKTSAEIQAKLAKAGASAILCDYDGGLLVSISFKIRTPHGLICFRLPSNVEGVFVRLSKSGAVPKKLKTREQAARVSWRILKDWIEAQLAMVDAEVAGIAEVFLPYAQDSRGVTVYESLSSNNFKSLALGFDLAG